MTKETFGKYLFYLASLAFTWTLVGAVIQTNLTADKLVKVCGIIDTTIEIATYKRKSNKKDHELRIYLKDTTEYFRFMDIYKFDNFRGKIHNGDSTAIFIRPKWLVPLGLGYRNDIFQMTINGETIFEVSQTKRNENGIIIVCLISIPLFIFLAQYIKKKRQKLK